MMITNVLLARYPADTSVFVFETRQLVSLPTSAEDIVTELCLANFRRHSKQMAENNFTLLILLFHLHLHF